MKILEVTQQMFFLSDTRDPQGDLARGSLSGFGFTDVNTLGVAIRRIEPYVDLYDRRRSRRETISVFASQDFHIGAGANGEDAFRNARFIAQCNFTATSIIYLLKLPPPIVLYHVAPIDERQSVLTHGLARRFSNAHLEFGQGEDERPLGGIFFASKPSHQNGHDLWAVNTQGLDLQNDETTDPGEIDDSWWVTYDEDVPPNRLKLVPPS